MMNGISDIIRRSAALAAAMLIFTAGSIPSKAAGSAEAGGSPAYFNANTSDEGGQNEGGGNEGGENEGGQSDTPGESSDQGNQPDYSAQIRQYSEHLNAALDDLEAHARALIAAGNAGNRKKYDSELQACDNAEKRVDEAINTDYGIPSADLMPIVNKAYKRLDQIAKLRDQAETALANSLGGAMDEDGKIYKLAKVNVSAVEVGKMTETYRMAISALGPNYNDKENQIVFKITLKVGSKPVHLIGGLTKSITIGIPNEKIGRSPVTSYYIWDNGDGNQSAPVAEKRGYFDKSTWCVTFKVSKSVSYFVVCGRPGSKGTTYAEDIVATDDSNQEITADDLRRMLTAVRLEENSEVGAEALEAVNAEDKFTAVYEIRLPDEVALLPETEAIAEISCPEAADRAVEIYRIAGSAAVWVGTSIADSEGNLQFTTDSLGVFVLTWNKTAEDEPPAEAADGDTDGEADSAPVWPWVAGTAAAVVIIIGAELLITSFFKKKS